MSGLPLGNQYDMPEETVTDSCSAFTVAELGEMLPNIIGDYVLDQIRMTTGEYGLLYRQKDKNIAITKAETEADARAKMLIYLLKNKLAT